MRLLPVLAALVAALSLAGTAGASAGALSIDRGVVQSVSASRIVLRELDGSIVTISVGPGTRVRLNGQPAQLSEIEPGFVAGVAHNGSRPARIVRAFGRVLPLIDRGVVVSASLRVVVIRTPAGLSVTLRVTPRTTIRRRGLPATIAAVRPGSTVEIAHTRAGVALRIAVHTRRTV